MTGYLSDLFSLDGKVAIVTGASKGLGLAIADGLTSAGALVFGVSRTEPDNIKQYKFNYESCDVTNFDAFRAVAESIFSTHGRVDILVNAAGISSASGSDANDKFSEILYANLISLHHCCVSVIPFMKVNSSGSIINVSSINANMGFPENPGYVASKGGVSALTRSLAVDYGAANIRVNNLVPGYFRTAMTEGSYSKLESRSDREKRTILGRYGEANEIVGASIFLASNCSSYMTGSSLVIDGGWSIKGL